MKTQFIVADLGLGNVGSVVNTFVKSGFSVVALAHPPRIPDGAAVIIPGVGAFDTGILAMRKSGWGSYITDFSSQLSIAGFCLGMQILGHSSEEGDQVGLGLLPLRFQRFESVENNGLKSPHVGWSTVRWREESSREIGGARARYYFSHSFASFEASSQAAIGLTSYGREFVSIARRGRIFGFQFHPEKSNIFGQLLIQRLLGPGEQWYSKG